MTPSRPFSSRQRLLLLLIVAGGFLLRLQRLGADSLWYDETVSALLASKSLPAMWAHTARDIHPPLYYALLHFWTLAAGHSEYALAFLSLIWGMLLIPFVAQLGRRWYGPRLGILAAFLLAVNPFAIWYSQEVRMYTLGALELAALLWVMWQIAYGDPQQQRRHLILYTLLAALALWTLYYTAFALVALNLVLLLWLWQRRRQTLVPWLAAQLGVVLLYAPWLPHALRQAFDPPVPPWRQALTWGELAITMLRQGSVALAFGQSLDPERWWPVGLLLLGLALWPVFSTQAGNSQRQAIRWNAVALLGPLLLIYLISQSLTPLYHVRYVALYSATYPLLLAAGWSQASALLRSRGRAVATAAFLLVVLVPTARSLQNYLGNRYAYEAADDLRGAVQRIAAQLGPRDAILVDAGYLYPALLVYWPEDIGWLGRLSEYPPQPMPPAQGPAVITVGHIDGDPSIGWGDPASDFYAIDHATAAAKLAQLFHDVNTVWLLRGYDTVNDPHGFVRQWLQDHGVLLHDELFAGSTYVRVQGWRTTTGPRTVAPAFDHAQTTSFGDGITLLGYDLAPARPQPGRYLRLTLYWQAQSPPTRSWKVFNQLIDEQWQVLAQADALPLNGIHPTDQWQAGEVVESTFVLTVPDPLPAGELRLISGFYNESNGARLPLAAGGDFVVLGAWQQEP